MASEKPSVDYLSAPPQTEPLDARARQSGLKSLDGIAVLAGGLLLYFLVSMFLQMGFIGRFLDDGQYFVSARSLAYTGEYRLTSRPGSVTSTKYPPGLPLLLSAPLCIFGDREDWRHDEALCRLVLRFCGVGFGLALYYFFRRSGLSSVASATAGIAVLFQPGVLTLNGRILSEVSFAALTCLLMGRWIGATFSQRGFAQAAVDGAIASGALLIRTSGIALLPAVVAACFMGRQKATSTLVVISMMAGSLWFSTLLGGREPLPPRGSGSYVAQLVAGYEEADAWFTIPVQRLTDMLVVSGELLVPGGAGRFMPKASEGWYWVISWLAGGIGLGFMLLGAWRLQVLRKHSALPVALFIAATLGLYVVWPFQFSYRFALPLSPLAMLLLSAGIGSIVAWALRRRAPSLGLMQAIWILLAAKGLALLAFTISNRVYVEGGWVTPADRDYLEALKVVQLQTEPDAIIGALAAESVYLYTGRQSFPIIDDDEMDLRHGNVKRLTEWIDRCGDRPIYLFAPVARYPTSDAKQLAELLKQDLPYRTEDRYMKFPFRLVKLHQD